jgi:hypothetical protein
MDEVQKLSNSECYAPSSETFRTYCCFMLSSYCVLVMNPANGLSERHISLTHGHFLGILILSTIQIQFQNHMVCFFFFSGTEEVILIMSWQFNCYVQEYKSEKISPWYLQYPGYAGVFKFVKMYVGVHNAKQ